MFSLKDVGVVLATTDDIPRLISFLSAPEIDQSFVYPLSRRTISIEARVRGKFDGGFWLIALHRGEVVGCRGCNGLIDRENKVVEFSTVAVSPAFRSRGLGTRLLRQAVEIAVARYAPLTMKLGSWSTNNAMERVARKVGFVKRRTFDDPLKRPPDVQSVEYVLDCSKS